MFDWLEKEIAAIKTPRFHVVDGPADGKLRDAILNSDDTLPQSYKEFVLRFGNAKLYRMARNDSYLIGIFAGPREATFKRGARVYQVGSHDGARVYLKPTSSAGYCVIEVEGRAKEKVADDFADWLAASCARARRRYGKEKWEEILRGPEPFTAEEEAIIDTRRRIRWRVREIDPAGDHVFEIANAGTRTLPVLTVGVRSKSRHLNGAVRLKIGHIGPGQTGLVHADCYKSFVPPDQIEIFAVPEPRPEDRDFFAEFEAT